VSPGRAIAILISPKVPATMPVDDVPTQASPHEQLGTLLRCAGVPPARAERLVAEWLADDAAALRAEMMGDLRLRLDDHLMASRRTVRQALFEFAWLHGWTGRRTGIGKSFGLLIAMALAAATGSYLGTQALAAHAAAVCGDG
jgi:hypothetical protein